MICVFDMRSHKPIMQEKTQNGAINLLQITDRGQLVTGSADASVKIYDIGNSKPLATSKVTAGVLCG